MAPRNLTFTDAGLLAAQGKPWTFKMQFQGLDPSNQSGWSDKFWLVTGRGINEPVEIHFGATGSAGQIQVKDWAYVAAKVPEKEAKGYRYVATDFVRLRQSTIDAHNAHKGAKSIPAPLPASQQPIPALASSPAPPPAPKTVLPEKTVKDPLTGGSVRIVLDMGVRQIRMHFSSKFPLRPGQDQVERQLIISTSGLRCKWESDTLFLVPSDDWKVVEKLASAYEAYLGVLPVAAPPVRVSPFDRITMVSPDGTTGMWVGLDSTGKRVMRITRNGAQQLLQQNPVVRVMGL